MPQDAFVDLEKFKRTASRNKKKLVAFLKKLDEIVPAGFSGIVAEEDARMWSRTDCTTCANCCKTMTPTYSQSDIKRIAAHFNMKPALFFKTYLRKEEDTGDVVNQSQPCPFLVSDKCSIYAIRPKDCAAFPHHHKRPFDLYNDTFEQNLQRCPATFRLIQSLEKRVNKEYEW